MFVVRESSAIKGVRFNEFSGKPTDAELDLYLEDQRRKLLRAPGESIVMVLELKDVWTSTQRKKMREFELEMTKLVTGTTLGMVMVVPNALVRGAFTAYFWIAPADYPTKMVGSAEEAYPFVVSCLRSANMRVPSEAEYRAAATAEWPALVAKVGQGLVPLQAA